MNEENHLLLPSSNKILRIQVIGSLAWYFASVPAGFAYSQLGLSFFLSLALFSQPDLELRELAFETQLLEFIIVPDLAKLFLKPFSALL